MKESIELYACAQRIHEALPKGVLLNTSGEKFNAMVIGWGALGTVWGVPAFTVYVREGRFTRRQLDATGEFTVSIPLGAPDPVIHRVCGLQSGREIDKAAAAKLTLEPAEVIKTPGIAEYPFTLECRVLFSQKLDIARLPEALRARMYPRDVDSSNPMANRDAHVMFIGQVAAAYVIR